MMNKEQMNIFPCYSVRSEQLLSVCVSIVVGIGSHSYTCYLVVPMNYVMHKLCQYIVILAIHINLTHSAKPLYICIPISDDSRSASCNIIYNYWQE